MTAPVLHSSLTIFTCKVIVIRIHLWLLEFMVLKFSSMELIFFLKTISGLILNQRLSLKDSDGLDTVNDNQHPFIPLFITWN